jgi:hypothetical protein
MHDSRLFAFNSLWPVCTEAVLSGNNSSASSSTCEACGLGCITNESVSPRPPATSGLGSARMARDPHSHPTGCGPSVLATAPRICQRALVSLSRATSRSPAVKSKLLSLEVEHGSAALVLRMQRKFSRGYHIC